MTIIQMSRYGAGGGGGGGRQPGVNTLAYYPLNSTSTVNDMSGNNLTLTAINNPTFGTNKGVDCVTLDNQSYQGFYNDNISFTYTTNSNRTMSIWIRPDTGIVWNGRIIQNIVSDWQQGFMCGKQDGTTDFLISRPYDDWKPFNLNMQIWNHIVMTWDTNFNIKVYHDGVYVANHTPSTIGDNDGLLIGTNSKTPNGDGYMRNGCFSELIFEDKERTAQEIQDYFNQTKSLYGIS